MEKKFKKIAIVEFVRTHYDFIISVHEYLYKKGYRDIKILTSSEIWKDTEYQLIKIENHINPTNVFTAGKVKNYFYILKNNFDVIYFNSFYYSWKNIIGLLLLKILKRDTDIILTLHNIRRHFEYKSKFKFAPLKKILITVIDKKTKKYIVLNEKLKEFASKYTKKEILVIPFKIPLKQEILTVYKNSSSFYKIIIPGIISNKRRNYDELIKVIKNVLSKRTDFKFILLGRIVSKELIVPLTRLKQQFPQNIQFFSSYIEQELFEKYVIESDIILAPIRKNVDSNPQEQYGLTKASGIEFDAYKYKKPILIPSFYEIQNENIDVTYFNTYDELTKILLKYPKKDNLLMSA